MQTGMNDVTVVLQTAVAIDYTEVIVAWAELCHFFSQVERFAQHHVHVRLAGAAVNVTTVHEVATVVMVAMVAMVTMVAMVVVVVIRN